jgi:hypothetical protein
VVLNDYFSIGKSCRLIVRQPKEKSCWKGKVKSIFINMDKKTFINYYLLLIFLIQLNTSCYSLFSLGKIRAKANQCCNFNPMQNKLTLNCKNEKIVLVRVSTGSIQPDIAGETFYQARFDPPQNEIILPSLPDSVKELRTITIDIWNSNQTIYDYTLTVLPENWKSEKVIFAKYSYR